jgi:hypothetical protein
MDGPVLRNATLADFLANGTVGRPDLQPIVSQVNAALPGQQAAIAAAFSRLFPDGLGKPLSTTADANGSYLLPTPPGVPGFVRCNPADAANLVLARFAPARQTGEKLLGQTVAPATTVAAMVVTNALQDGLDPVPIQNTFLADIAPLQILLPDHPNGNGTFATVQLQPGTTLPNRNEALLAFAATTIFDTMRLQKANIPAAVTFANAVQDYFKDATFAPQFAPLTQAVNTALDQGQPVIGLGRNDIPQAARTVGALSSQLFISDANGVLRYDGTTGAFLNVFAAAGSGRLGVPGVLVFGPDGQLYVANFIGSSAEILRYDGRTGAFRDVFVAAGSGGLFIPISLVFGPDGQLYVANTDGFGGRAILRYDGTTGAFRDVFVAGLVNLAGEVFFP